MSNVPDYRNEFRAATQALKDLNSTMTKISKILEHANQLELERQRRHEEQAEEMRQIALREVARSQGNMKDAIRMLEADQTQE